MTLPARIALLSHGVLCGSGFRGCRKTEPFKSVQIHCLCEERSDEAISAGLVRSAGLVTRFTRLPRRFAPRNDATGAASPCYRTVFYVGAASAAIPLLSCLSEHAGQWRLHCHAQATEYARERDKQSPVRRRGRETTRRNRAPAIRKTSPGSDRCRQRCRARPADPD